MLFSGESFASGSRLFSCPTETLHGSDHLLDFGLYAESSIAKFSSQATTPSKICRSFDIVLVNCRNVSMVIVLVSRRSLTPPFLVIGSTVQDIDDSSQSRPYGLPTPFLVTETTVQECGLARSARYYITTASPSHYAVSSIGGSSQIRFYDPLTGAAIFCGGFRTSYSQNPLVGLFNVIFDFLACFLTWALGLQVKLLYGLFFP
ncbi:hypothetical protein DY000_02039817 [Brassica cretica]|uniref:Uncharacterized protein n=1 Tax=Brassica cretica TaxID=69181 RepID=A0ABQ7BHF9_BRACR|nr:hypothetical protein DY000_02039817 [Brassica cretica]